MKLKWQINDEEPIIKELDDFDLTQIKLCLMPSTDVVEVVRCENCVYGIENGELCGRKVYLCSTMTNPNEFYGDFYCAFGERKDDEGKNGN